MKKLIYKFFGTVLKKNHGHVKGIDLQVHNLTFSQKGILDFMLLQPLLMYV